MSVYPISFSINNTKILDKVPAKTKLLAFIEPGNLKTYIYDNEEDYYNDYKNSFFALTKKKAGWDCMRHYEILANGCIPLFLDLQNCPTNIMTHFPKEIVLEAEKLYFSMKKTGLNSEDMTLCYKYIEKLLEYTRNNLSNQAMAKYILEKNNMKNVKNILFLSGNICPDYLRCVTLCGFKELYGEKCHDYPKISHIYKDCQSVNNLYGKGISYTQLIEKDKHNEEYDKTISADIEEHKYDLILYGSYHRGMPLWELVNKFYKKNEIVLLCGEDDHWCNYKEYANLGYNVFVRELK